jgi:hypothetical protein
VACAGGGRMHGDWAGGGRFTVLAGVAYDFRACMHRIDLILFIKLYFIFIKIFMPKKTKTQDEKMEMPLNTSKKKVYF